MLRSFSEIVYRLVPGFHNALEEINSLRSANTNLSEQLNIAEAARWDVVSRLEKAEAARWDAVSRLEKAEAARWDAVSGREKAEAALAESLRRGFRPFLGKILNEEFGGECKTRMFGYFNIIDTLEVLPERRSSLRKEALASYLDRLKLVSGTRDDDRSIDVSIIIPAYNHVEYTIACIQSILEHFTKHRYEIIVGNDVSTDETREIFEAVGGVVRVITHATNGGFIRNCNLSARSARGRYIVMLNNDTFVLDGWLDALIEPFFTMEQVGLVGSKLLMPDGRLQEAGGLFWSDGSAWNFGRNQDPRLPEFNYLKDVDYVSGASIAIPKAIWDEVGGFDEQYVPAYCDDSDLAFTLRSKGYRTLYQPFSAVIHHEGISHGTDTTAGVKAYQLVNTGKFLRKWASVLAADHFRNGADVFLARDHSAGRPHILVIDHCIPQSDKDAGSKTIFQYLELFVNAGFHVTFWPDNLFHDRPYARILQSIGIEVLYGKHLKDQFDRWIEDNGRYLQYVFMSRAQVSMNYIDAVRKHSSAKVVFYGHDINVLRLEQERIISKSRNVDDEIAYWRPLESAMWAKADVVYYPAQFECDYVRHQFPEKTIRLIPPFVYSDEQMRFKAGKPANARPPYLLFVAGFRHRPNADAILWFCREVLPAICLQFPDVVTLVVGSHPPPEVESLASDNIVVTGQVSDAILDAFYRSATISVVPLRFGGGVKGKVIEALRHATPVVTTSIGAQGLVDAQEYLELADDRDAFANAVIRLLGDPGRCYDLTERGLQCIKKHFSIEAATKVLALDIPELT